MIRYLVGNQGKVVTDMASKSCFASGVDHFLSSCLRGAVAVKLRKDEEFVAGRINDVVARRSHRELAGLRALAAMVAAGLIMVMMAGSPFLGG
jgi:hypothetical protein